MTVDHRRLLGSGGTVVMSSFTQPLTARRPTGLTFKPSVWGRAEGQSDFRQHIESPLLDVHALTDVHRLCSLPHRDVIGRIGQFPAVVDAQIGNVSVAAQGRCA